MGCTHEASASRALHPSSRVWRMSRECALAGPAALQAGGPSSSAGAAADADAAEVADGDDVGVDDTEGFWITSPRCRRFLLLRNQNLPMHTYSNYSRCPAGTVVIESGGPRHRMIPDDEQRSTHSPRGFVRHVSHLTQS